MSVGWLVCVSLCIPAHLHALLMSHLAIASVLSRGWTPPLATFSNMKKKQPKCVPFEKKVLFLCEYNSVVSVYVSEMDIDNATKYFSTFIIGL